ncbi:LCP family protein [Micromonospora sp. CPCC 205711]|uniref:LCP family protein n=1 Tax=Micromonospora sp. CPCC 205547 TaxID=3122400 RepID=UPI002FEF4C04
MSQASGARRPRWILGVAALGAVLLVVAAALVIARLVRDDEPSRRTGAVAATGTPQAATTSQAAAPSPTAPPGTGVTGPLNLLVVGLDTRVSVPGWEPHSDAVLVLHVPAGLDRAYLFSLPRDLLVDIPAFPKSGWKGGRTKLTHSMSYGSRVPGKPKEPNPAQGYELLRSTVSGYTGLRIDAGAVINFPGFEKLVNTLGGVDLYVDEKVTSIHRRPDGKYRDLLPSGGGYTGPQMVYEPGDRHLNGWQALDYGRQRYITGGDYARQRHQQQLIRALTAKILSDDLARQPDRVQQVIDALGASLIYVGGPRIVDVAYALGGLDIARFTLVALPGKGVGKGSAYKGEQLTPVGRGFLPALKAGDAEQYLDAHPELRVKN